MLYREITFNRENRTETPTFTNMELYGRITDRRGSHTHTRIVYTKTLHVAN